MIKATFAAALIILVVVVVQAQDEGTQDEMLAAMKATLDEINEQMQAVMIDYFPPVPCAENEFSCERVNISNVKKGVINKCIPVCDTCNGYNNCDDGSDEKDCGDEGESCGSSKMCKPGLQCLDDDLWAVDVCGKPYSDEVIGTCGKKQVITYDGWCNTPKGTATSQYADYDYYVFKNDEIVNGLDGGEMSEVNCLDWCNTQKKGNPLKKWVACQENLLSDGKRDCEIYEEAEITGGVQGFPGENVKCMVYVQE